MTGRSRSLSLVVPKSGDTTAGCITHELKGPITELRLAFDVRIVETGTGSVDVFRLGALTAPNIEVQLETSGEIGRRREQCDRSEEDVADRKERHDGLDARRDRDTRRTKQVVDRDDGRGSGGKERDERGRGSSPG